MRFEILGKPTGKGRPRLGKYGTYTPQKTKDYEELVKLSFKSKYKVEPSEKEIKMKITAVFEPPRRLSKKKRAELIDWEQGYMHKPDIDNIAKIILDALNDLAYKDDNQVTALLVFKQYGTTDKVVVEMEEL